MGLQFLYLLVRDGKPQLLLCLSQRNPELSPGTKLHIR